MKSYYIHDLHNSHMYLMRKTFHHHFSDKETDLRRFPKVIVTGQTSVESQVYL